MQRGWCRLLAGGAGPSCCTPFVAVERACSPATVPQPFRPLPDWEFKDYLGWMEQGDGKLSYGVYIQVRRHFGVFLRRWGCGGQAARSAQRGAGAAGVWRRAALCRRVSLLRPQNGRVKGEAKKALRNVIER